MLQQKLNNTAIPFMEIKIKTSLCDDFPALENGSGSTELDTEDFAIFYEYNISIMDFYGAGGSDEYGNTEMILDDTDESVSVTVTQIMSDDGEIFLTEEQRKQLEKLIEEKIINNG